MQSFIIFLLAAAATYNVCRADIRNLRPEDRKVLQDAAGFHEVYATTNLPPRVVFFCADNKGRIAEPGQKWEATDIISDSSTLPRKRLRWAVIKGDYYVIHYESGGRGHGYHVLVARFKPTDTEAKCIWHAVGKPLKDYRTLLDAIEHNALSDELEYAH